ncbi:DeoR/GlpR family DNA-binding transcription regulator [Amphibiibacter pelophylacis]|uniref:DeoR/GlpR family DNA-binding transcription regulator n=1 Tax=Amphibiibacter pelophylacis TaxID=1799477 RepID=A0ACC6NZF8_9BURK
MPSSARPTLIPNPRQQRLLDCLREAQVLSVEALAHELDVTLQTVRRDVKLLDQAGRLARFHGGVRTLASTTENVAYRTRQQWHENEKKRIAERLAQDVPDGSSLILSIGTTTEAIARALAGKRGLRVITNNLHVASILSVQPDCEVIVSGGLVRGVDQGIVGETAVDFIRQFRVDFGLIGISSIEPDGTLRDFDLREVKVAQAIVAQSRQVWLAADSSKFARSAMVEVGHLRMVQRLYTDAPPPDSLQAVLDESGVGCVVVG